MDNTTAETVANGLEKARRSGDGWTACCPAHGDENPSLSVTDGVGGRVLVKCHKGCTQEDVIAELKARGLWPERRNGKVVSVSRPYMGNRETTSKGSLRRYHYYRPDGVLHVEVCMYRDSATGKKVGRRPWREPSGVKAPHPLYCVRELPERPADPVLVVEGERTVEHAAEHFPDYLVTTSIGGSSQAGDTDWSPLAGRAVVVWPDNDASGIKHAEKVSKLATAAGAASVRIVELPVLPAKWDLADPVPPGVDVRAILEHREELKSIRLDDLLAMPDPVVQWLVESRLPAVGSSVLGGGKAVGKSVLARTLAAAVADGRPWLGWDTAPGTSLYIAHEDGLLTVKRHFQSLAVNHADRLHVVLEREPTGRERYRRLCGSVEAIKPSLVIVDTMIRFVDIADSNDYATTVAALSPFVDLARAKGFHILFTHHSRKSGGEHGTELLGSVGITAAADTVLSLAVENDRRIVYGFGRDGVEIEKTVVRLDDDGRAQAFETKRAADTRAVGRNILEFVEAESAPVTRAQIREGVGGRTASVSAALRDLVTDNDLGKEGTGKAGDPVRYVVSRFPK